LGGVRDYWGVFGVHVGRKTRVKSEEKTQFRIALNRLFKFK